MSTTKKTEEYVDPILIKEGFFENEEDYVQTMDEIFKGLREAVDKGQIKRRERSKPSSVPNPK